MRQARKMQTPADSMPLERVSKKRHPEDYTPVNDRSDSEKAKSFEVYYTRIVGFRNPSANNAMIMQKDGKRELNHKGKKYADNHKHVRGLYFSGLEKFGINVADDGSVTNIVNVELTSGGTSENKFVVNEDMKAMLKRYSRVSTKTDELNVMIEKYKREKQTEQNATNHKHSHRVVVYIDGVEQILTPVNAKHGHGKK